jgi:S1-C subfamily serine protease
VPFEVRDVSVDEQAAREMVMRTRQMGVPVIADEHEAIVGFDMPRLQRMAARHRRGPGLGLKVADAKDGPGVYVGGVRDDSPGARAGVEVGDVIIELSGRAISSVEELEQVSSRRPPGQPTSLMVRRNGELRTLILR